MNCMEMEAMLEENELSWTNGLDVKKFTDKQYKFICPKCGNEEVISRKTLDQYLTSDVHNPSQDFLVCCNCDAAYGLYKGVKMDDGSEVTSDGSFVYVEDSESKEVYRLA